MRLYPLTVIPLPLLTDNFSVMGPTGVGKSTVCLSSTRCILLDLHLSFRLKFINTLLGRNVMRVGHDITSCTSKLEYAVVDKPTGLDCRVVVVDTPGFDDTYEEDVEILRRIAVWLASS